MALASLLQYFWCQVVWCAAHCCPPDSAIVALGDKQRGKTEVTNLDVHVVVQEEVAGLEVSMDDVALVQVFDGAACLDHKPSNFRHGEVFTLLDGVGKGTVLA